MVLLAICIPSLFRTLIVTPKTLVESLLFIPHFSHSFPSFVWPLLVPGWTLNFEMFFYAVFACTLLLPERFRIAALIAAFGTLVAVGLAFGPFDSAAARVYFSPLLIEFVAGAAIGTWWQARRFAPHPSVSALLLAAGFALLACRDEPPFRNFTEMIGATMMVAGALHPAFADWKNGLLRALGDSSYSLYLTHLFTLGILRVVWGKFLPPIATASNAGAFLVAALVTCGLVGWLTFRFLETPMLRWFGARMKRARAAAASVAV
jgi:exopolysaccharide production protein ExoZ